MISDEEIEKYYADCLYKAFGITPEDFEKDFISKQRVREAIDKVFNIDDEEDKVHNKMIKKELMLDK